MQKIRLTKVAPCRKVLLYLHFSMAEFLGRVPAHEKKKLLPKSPGEGLRFSRTAIRNNLVASLLALSTLAAARAEGLSCPPRVDGVKVLGETVSRDHENTVAQGFIDWACEKLDAGEASDRLTREVVNGTQFLVLIQEMKVPEGNRYPDPYELIGRFLYGNFARQVRKRGGMSEQYRMRNEVSMVATDADDRRFQIHAVPVPQGRN